MRVVIHLTCALQENEACDDQHRMPVEFSQSSVPVQAFLKVENPPQHEYYGDKPDSSGSGESEQELLQILHRASVSEKISAQGQEDASELQQLFSNIQKLFQAKETRSRDREARNCLEE